MVASALAPAAREKALALMNSPRPLEELLPLDAPATVAPPLPVSRSTAALFTDMEKLLCGQTHVPVNTLFRYSRLSAQTQGKI